MADEHNPYDLEGQALAEKKRHGTQLSEKAEWDGHIRWLMGHRRGRIVVNTLLKEAMVEINPFNANALQMANQCGHQRRGTDLLKVIKRVALEEYFTMLKEHVGT